MVFLKKAGYHLNHMSGLKNAILSEEGLKNIEKVKKLTKIAEDLGISMSGYGISLGVKKSECKYCNYWSFKTRAS